MTQLTPHTRRLGALANMHGFRWYPMLTGIVLLLPWSDRLGRTGTAEIECRTLKQLYRHLGY